MKANRIIASILLMIFSFYQIPFAFAQQEDKIVIAIVDFKNTGNDSALDYLERSIPESISTNMARSGKLEIAERSRLQDALQEMEMGMTGVIDEKTAVELGRAVGANAILVGSFFSIEDEIRLNSRLIDVETARIITADNVQGKVGKEIFNLIDEMAITMENNLVKTPEKPTEVEKPEEPAQPTIPEKIETPEVEEQPVQPAPKPEKVSQGSSIFSKWWFWGLLAAAGGGAAVALSGGDDDGDSDSGPTGKIVVTW